MFKDSPLGPQAAGELMQARRLAGLSDGLMVNHGGSLPSFLHTYYLPQSYSSAISDQGDVDESLVRVAIGWETDCRW